MSAVVVRETFRRHVTHIAFISFLILAAMLSLGVSAFNPPASVWPWLMTVLALITGCGPIGPEFSSGTLQLILVKPVNRAVYLLSRVTGVVLAVCLAACVCAGVELLGRAIWGESVHAATIGSTLLSVFADTILTVSMLALLGSLTRAYFNIAIYVVAMAGMSMLEVLLVFLRQTRSAVGALIARTPVIERVLQVIEHNLFPELPPHLDGAWILMVLSNAAVALVLACLVFRRREVPYGAD